MYRMSTDYIRLPKEFKKDIEILLDIILERDDVLRIVLFGSCARQLPGPDSDIDMAIVLEDIITWREGIKIMGEIREEAWKRGMKRDHDLYFIDKDDWLVDKDYKEYGYAELLDLYTVGNYYTTITIDDYLENNPEVKNETDMWAQQGTWYCVEGSNMHLKSILDGNKFYGGILADQFYSNPDGLTESIKMNLATSDGLMIFDIVHIIEKNMWDYVEKGMREGGAI